VKAHQEGSLFSIASFFFYPIISSLQASNFGFGDRNGLKATEKLRVVVALLAGLCLTLTAHAQTNGWGPPSRGSSDWNTPSNWAPAAPLGGPTGTALFGTAATTSLTFSGEPNGVGALRFNANAPAYTFTLIDHQLNMNGTGIENLSSQPPQFTIQDSHPNGEGDSFSGLIFNHRATAANAVIRNETLLNFFGTSTADHATITTEMVRQFNGTNFGSAGTAFFNTSTAGHSTLITLNFGATDFLDMSTADHATIMTNDNGVVRFDASASGGQATFITNAGGAVDISSLTTAGTTAGSIEGAGDYYLGEESYGRQQ
jgi:hypothetical protein